jgi:hypothetical protein
MKKIFTFIALVLLTANVFAQAPQKMSYQAVIRNSSDVLVASTAIGMKISILQGSASGTLVYAETQSATTNLNGLVTVEIGNGSVVTGTFSAINWANGPYFIKTETDPTGGTSYTISGTSELMSVPYALFSASGAPGPQGPAGADGINGANGADGATGPQGPAGTNGANGADGINGANGADGATGPAGANGADGATGPAGADGAIGATGPAGADGADGATGPAGADGADGATGPAGANGANGADGATGPAGADGATGPAGTNGADGATGPAGADGANGADGATGPAGADGAIGATGPAGTNGADGATGPAGANGADGATGPAGADGAIGATGPAGANGADGATGPAGPQGPAGPNGVDLTTNQTVAGNKTFTGDTTLGSVGAQATFNSWTTFGDAFWINMPTTGPSGIGSGGAGTNPWIGYCSDPGNWFADSLVGDIAYRNTTSSLLFGNTDTALKINNNIATFTNPVIIPGYTVATLPAGIIGQTAYVTDALAPAYLTAVVGGGAVVTPVFYDGTTWVAH